MRYQRRLYDKPHERKQGKIGKEDDKEEREMGLFVGCLLAYLMSQQRCCTLSTHTDGVLDERGGQRSHAASPQHSLSLNNNLTNSDSLVEFFIHPCKFLKYSISFSFNKIKFLLSPKIHDYSLTITRDSPALEVHAKAAPRWLAQRSLSHQSRHTYLNPRTLGGNKVNMAKQQEKSIISQATPCQPLSAPPTYRSGILQLSARANRQVVNTIVITR